MASKQAIEAYRTALMRAMQDGTIDPSEQNILDGLRESLGITPQEHGQIERWVYNEISFRMRQNPIPPENIPPGQQGGLLPSIPVRQPPVRKPPALNSPGLPPPTTGPGSLPPPPPPGAPPPQPVKQPGHAAYNPGQERQVRRPLQKKAPKGNQVKRATRASTGGKHLDDMLGGGMPFKSNVLVIGPTFIGKESFLNQFAASGLKAGIPVLMVITDRTSTDARKGLLQMTGDLANYESRGLIKYVDAHSLTVGMIGKNPNAKYVRGFEDIEALKTAITHFQGMFKQNFFYHRVIVSNLSSLLRTRDLNTVINFLQTTNARNKAYNAICLYDISAGVHQPNEILSIKNTMDGSFEFRTEEGKNHVQIQGLEDVKNREWMEYSSSVNEFDVKGGFGFQYIS